MRDNEVIMCNHCKAIYRFEPSLCDCIQGNEAQSYSKWYLVPEIPTREILATMNRVAVVSGHNGMDEPTYTNLSELESRDIYARIAVAAGDL